MYGEIPSEIAELDFSAPPVGELSPLEEPYEALDVARDLFLGSCEEFTADPTAEAEEDLRGYAREVASTFRQAVAAAQDTLAPSAAVEAIFGLAQNHDYLCISTFASLVGEEGFMYVSRKGLHTEISKLATQAANDEEFIDGVAGQFGRFHWNDIATFVKKAREQAENRRSNTLFITIGRSAIVGQRDTPDETGETYTYYPFCIEPPLQVHKQDFLGPYVQFDYSDQRAMYGKFWVADSYGLDMEAEEREEAIQEKIYETFDEGLNPFGYGILDIRWQPGGPEQQAPGDTPAEG